MTCRIFLKLFFCLALSFALGKVANTETTTGRDNEIDIEFTLTEDEKAWLENRPGIRIGIMDAWPPMNFVDERGVFKGIGVDYIECINKRLGGLLVPVAAPFKENFENVKNRRLDALMDITPKKDREPFFHFTMPYLTIPHVIVARKDGPGFRSESDLKGRTVALERGFYNVKYFRENHPEVKINEYASTSEALDAVARGEADAYAGNRATSMHIIERELLANLTATGRMNQPPVVLTIGVRKDWPELAKLLDRALASVTRRETRRIHHRWLEALGSAKKELMLTPHERNWLSQHPVIRVASNPDWAPVEFADGNGNFTGISVDYLRRIEKMLDVKFEFAGKTYKEPAGKLETRDPDMASAMNKTPDREKILLFTTPYKSTPLVLFARDDVPYAGSLSELKGRKVAVAGVYSFADSIRRNYPGIKVVEAANIRDALELLASREVFAFAGPLLNTSHYIEAEGRTNIKVSGETPWRCEIAMAVRSDWPVFAGILDRALQTIDESERNAIRRKYVSVRYEYGFDYSLLWKISLPVLAVLGLFVYWNRRLANEISVRKHAEKELSEIRDGLESMVRARTKELKKEIDERKRAEASIRLNEERLKGLLELSRMGDATEQELIEFALEEGVRLTESKGGYLHYFDEETGGIRLCSWSKDVRLECGAEKVTHYPLDKAGVWADSVRRREPVVHNDFQNLPDRKGYPEGHFPVYRHMSVPVTIDGRIIALAGVGNKETDYTEDDVRQLALLMTETWRIIQKNKIVKLLRESEEKHRQLFINAQEGIFVQQGGMFKFFNPKMTEILGYPSEEIASKHFTWFVSSNGRHETELRKMAEAADGMRGINVFRIADMAGNEKWVELNSVRIEWEGHPATLNFVNDITRRKRAEDELRSAYDDLEIKIGERTRELTEANARLMELDRLKSMFIASMSHELRTPLNSIIGFTGMLLQGMSGELNSEQTDDLSRVYKASKHLLSLITDVIDISKVEAGRVEIFPERFSLEEIVDEAAASIRPQLKEKDLALEINAESWPEMFTDRKRLLQCLLNLLSNAFKYTEKGKISVSVRENGKMVEIAVADTGIGIPPGEMTKLFEAFERLDTHMRVKAGGAGLGLYLTKKIATDLLKGDVLAESEPGHGSVFRLSTLREINHVE